MNERVRQELATPSVVHFYTWLLRSMPHGACCLWLSFVAASILATWWKIKASDECMDGHLQWVCSGHDIPCEALQWGRTVELLLVASCGEYADLSLHQATTLFMQMQASRVRKIASSSWAHAGYTINGTFLNHCIASFLKRLVAPDALNLEPMLYQVEPLSPD